MTSYQESPNSATSAQRLGGRKVGRVDSAPLRRETRPGQASVGPCCPSQLEPPPRTANCGASVLVVVSHQLLMTMWHAIA